MESKRRVIVKRIDGVYVDLFLRPVKNMSSAARFINLEEYNQFMRGYYAPADPSLYVPQVMEITYREVGSDERTKDG